MISSESKTQREILSKAHLQIKQAHLREEITARWFFRKLVRHSDSSMTVWSSDTLSESTFLKREINQKSFRIRMSSYSEVAEHLNKRNELSVFNQENFLWTGFLELLPDLSIEMTNSMRVDQSSGSVKQVRKSLKKKSLTKTINKAWNFIITSDTICASIIQEFVFIRKSVYDAFIEWVSVC